MPRPPPEENEGEGVSPDEAFALLGNGTRVGILQALWDAFESGKGENALPYSDLFTRVDIACPICDAPIEIAYADELVTATCTACEGALRWNGESGFLFLGLVPPAGIEQRSIEDAFRATATHTFREIAALADDVCPHCASSVETTIDVCPDHDSGMETLCPTCDRSHMADVWMVCATCKRSAFPPARGVVLDHPAVTTFYYEHDIEYRFASWETAVHSFDVREELISEDPLGLRFRIPAGDDELQLTVDDELNVLDVIP